MVLSLKGKSCLLGSTCTLMPFNSVVQKGLTFVDSFRYV